MTYLQRCERNSDKQAQAVIWMRLERRFVPRPAQVAVSQTTSSWRRYKERTETRRETPIGWAR